MIIVIQFIFSVGRLCTFYRIQRQEWHDGLVLLTLLINFHLSVELLLVLVQVHGSEMFLHQRNVVIIVVITFVIIVIIFVIVVTFHCSPPPSHSGSC